MNASATSLLQRAALGARARRLVVDGVDLAFDDDGHGPAVVCLHAIGHGAADFTRLRSRLSPRHRVIAVDWPGHGNSGADRMPASAQRYESVLDQFLDAVGVPHAVLIGNSIGGAAALLHAAHRPERTRALIVENPGGLAPTSDWAARVALGVMVRFFAAGARQAHWFPAAFAAYYRLCVLPAVAARATRLQIVQAATEMAPVLEQAWRSFAQPAADLRPVIDRIRCPVLFAWAERDRFVQLSRSRPAIERFAHARLECFAATHAAHLEVPEAFEMTVERFLDEVGWREVSGGVRPAAATG